MALEDRPGWHTMASKPVLQLLEGVSPYWMNTSTIVFNLNYHLEDGPRKSTVYDHLDELVTAGVIEQQKAARGTKVYRITEKGQAWLEDHTG